MKTRQDIIDFCLTFPDCYEDYPFKDTNWTLMRHLKNKKNFASIHERFGEVWVNLKVEPAAGEFWRNTFADVVPAYHMNKTHWISVILRGNMSDDEIKMLINDSYNLTCKK